MAHLRAYRALLDEAGQQVCLFLHPDYREMMGEMEDTCYTAEVGEILAFSPELVLIYNISLQNLPLLRACRRRGIRSVYVLHEPRGSFRDLCAEGRDAARALGAWAVNDLLCRLSDQVLLASASGVRSYERHMRGVNGCYDLFPLIFCDEYDSQREFERRYFSFIGTFVAPHGGAQFLSFVRYALARDPQIRFLIATRSEMGPWLREEVFQSAMREGRLVVQAGRPMTSEEINGFYRQSICVWNAYSKSTQSGVLPNALMQGAPVLVNRNGAAREVVRNRREGCFVRYPADNEQVMGAYHYICRHLGRMQESAREAFLEKYWYRSQLQRARRVILKERGAEE